jgi:hypothetical protein
MEGICKDGVKGIKIVKELKKNNRRHRIRDSDILSYLASRTIFENADKFSGKAKNPIDSNFHY